MRIAGNSAASRRQARATAAFMPWTALRNEPCGDGWFMALEYMGNWSLSVERRQAGAMLVSAGTNDLAAVALAPGQNIDLPAVTVGAFAGDLDDMGGRIYDWQYRYLWDYTNMDYYARPKWAVPWFYCACNLQEQFAERLAHLDMHADLMRSIGFEMLWDDAGWSVFDGLPPDNYSSVFTSTYEGPDFRQTLRYLEKMGMRWLAWFARRPSPGVMAGKVGAWGDFEWRTDAVDFPDWAADRDLRDKIVRFLDSYRHGRQGKDFVYSIPVVKGLYAVRLKFTEPRYPGCFSRPFNVELNGREMLRNFDICQDARGFQKAHDRVFRYVVPNDDGNIVLRFSAGFEPGRKPAPAVVQAIEVVPEIKPVLRIHCGADTDFIDWNSLVWQADCGFTGGRVIGSSSPVAEASPTLYDQALYQTARSGRTLSYTLPLPPGLYTVHLKFAELWLKEPGQRPMDIAINGRTVWPSWDPGAAAGQVGMALHLRALNVTPDKTGSITIRARAAGANDAILQGIEVE